MSEVKLTHTELKDAGNKYYSHCQYSKACDYYKQAIRLQPGISTYYTNRALCYHKMKEWDKVIDDCKQALELDNTNIKGHYLLGEGLAELGHFDEALSRLYKAHEMSSQQRRNYGDDITATIRSVKRKKFEAADLKRRQQEIELQTYIERLIIEDAERQKSKLLNIETETIIGTSSNSNAVDEIDRERDRRVSQLDELFAQVDERRRKREVPDHLCGKISFELMRDPVITPSGLTYERSALLQHLHRVGHFDPISRQPLTEDQLIPNLAFKEVVYTFLEDNPWAEDY